MLTVAAAPGTSSGANRRQRQADDAGTTLVELLVGIVMSTVVGTMVVLFMITTVRSVRQAEGANEQAAAARVALQSWSVLARQAVDPLGSSAIGKTRFFSLTPTEAKFCAALASKGADPDVAGALLGVSMKLAGGQIIESRWTTCAAMTAGALADDSRVLVDRAAQLTNVWLVTPLAAIDLPLGSVVSSGLLTSSLTVGIQPLTADTLPRIAAVQLAFQTLSDPGRPATGGVYSTVTALPIGS